MNYTSIEAQIRHYTNYDMIQAHTDLPAFPEQRVTLLYHFLHGSHIHSEQMKELYGLATSLVQIGLDTHDLVNNDDIVVGSRGERTRQLSILAGDYLSSRFYQILSKAGQIDMIRRLSVAICDLNTRKMNLYQKMKSLALSADGYIQDKVGMKTCLFSPFIHIMEGAYKQLWPELLDHVSHCEVILEELQKDESQTYESWAYWYIQENGQTAHTNIRTQLIRLFDEHWKQLMDKLSPFRGEHWFNDLAVRHPGKLAQENMR